MADPLHTLSMATMREVQDMLRWWRAVPRHGSGEVPPEWREPATPRLFRTQGPNETPDDAEYPTQVDGDGFELPGKFLRVTFDDAASDPVSVDTIELERNLYSPWGWIPRLVDVEVVMVSGMLVVNYVPIIPVQFDGSSVTAPDDLTAEILDYGDADTQEFTVHVLTQPGSSTEERGYAWLNPREKRWEIIAGGGGESHFQFELTEDMGATTSDEASATIKSMDGVTTIETSVVLDPLGIFASLLDESVGFCVRVDGAYYVIQALCTP